MIKRLTSASICFALASAAFADTGAKDVSEEDPVAAETAAGLDAFVDSAIRSGLLVPNENGTAADGVPRYDSETLEKLGVDCRNGYPLDFAVVNSLRRFNELPSTVAETDADLHAKLIEDLKSKMALGLYSEAKALIATAPETEWVAFRRLLALMENRARPDLEYFKGLESCFSSAGLWRAAAQLIVFEDEGVEALGERIGDVRALPYTMREDVAVMVIPSLLIKRRADLDKKKKKKKKKN